MQSRDVNVATRLVEASWRRDNTLNECILDVLVTKHVSN